VITRKHKKPERHPVLIIADFDGTISLNDMGYDILNRFSEDGWQEIDRSYCAGQIGSLEAYTRIFDFIRGSEEEMIRFVDEKAIIDPSFHDFYALCREKGFDVKIFSDGLDFYIDFILRKHGLGMIEFHSNVVRFRGERRVGIDFPHANETCGKCGTCKSRLLDAERSSYEKIIYIGDGYSDVCPARRADLVFAKGVLYDRIAGEGKHCVSYRRFQEIYRYFNENGNLMQR
jgi:2-hydroxy-3-keto-5-methylthiopentenyl-1-phosphate phosphatase